MTVSFGQSAGMKKILCGLILALLAITAVYSLRTEAKELIMITTDGAEYNGYIGTYGDQNTYYFELNEKATVVISLCTLQRNIAWSCFTADQTNLKFSAEKTETQVLTAGKYYLAVGCRDCVECVGDYSISVTASAFQELDPEPNDDPAHAINIKVNQSYEGRALYGDDVADWYRFRLEKKSRVFFSNEYVYNYDLYNEKTEFITRMPEHALYRSTHGNAYDLDAGVYYIKVSQSQRYSMIFDYTLEVYAYPYPQLPVIRKLSQKEIGSLDIAWTPVANASKYTIYYRSSLDGAWSKIIETKSCSYSSANDNSSIVKGPLSGGARYYLVTAEVEYEKEDSLVAVLESDYTNAVGRKLNGIVPVPKKLKAKKVKKGVKLTWEHAPYSQKYILYRKTGNGSYKRLKTLSGAVRTYTDKTVKKGKTYTYAVKAVYQFYGTTVSSLSKAAKIKIKK